MDKKQKWKVLLCALHGDNLVITDEVLEQLVSISQEVTFHKQQMILNIGEKQRYVYLIVSGIARSYYIDNNGSDRTKMFIHENEFLIGEALFMDESLEVFEAIEELVCLQFDAIEIKKILMENQELEKLYISILEDTLRYKMRREYNFQCMNATQRYLEFKKTYPYIEKRIPQNLIASYLGIAKESLSRIRKNISKINKC